MDSSLSLSLSCGPNANFGVKGIREEGPCFFSPSPCKLSSFRSPPRRCRHCCYCCCCCRCRCRCRCLCLWITHSNSQSRLLPYLSMVPSQPSLSVLASNLCPWSREMSFIPSTHVHRTGRIEDQASLGCREFRCWSYVLAYIYIYMKMWCLSSFAFVLFISFSFSFFTRQKKTLSPPSVQRRRRKKGRERWCLSFRVCLVSEQPQCASVAPLPFVALFCSVMVAGRACGSLARLQNAEIGGSVLVCVCAFFPQASPAAALRTDTVISPIFFFFSNSSF